MNGVHNEEKLLDNQEDIEQSGNTRRKKNTHNRKGDFELEKSDKWGSSKA